MQGINKRSYNNHLNEPRYSADKAFSFIPSEDMWKIGLNTTINISFIHESSLTIEQKEDLLNALAFRVSDVGSITSKVSIWAFNKFVSNLEGKLTSQSAQQSYDNLSDHYKNSISYSLKTFIQANNSLQNEILYVFYLNNCQSYKGIQRARRIFDPKKGAHTPIELESLLEGMRILTRNMHQYLDEPRPFFKSNNRILGDLMGGLALVLMMSILRRPVQLRQIKMCDFRTNNGNFDTEFFNDDILLDYDELKLQTFRAKGLDSKNRSELDEDLHLLNRDNSKLIIRYCSKIFAEHLNRLKEKGLELNKEEKREIFKRFPLFPTYSCIAAIQVESKEQLFSMTHTETTSNHIVIETLAHMVYRVIDNTLLPTYNSDRNAHPTERVTGNNRIRHTILTMGARDGLDGATLAAITGVSLSTVAAYLDLAPQERAMIDDVFGNNATLVNFGNIKIQDQLYSDDIALDEYGNEYGSHENAMRCAGCKETLPVPLSCYGCDNFTALSTGNHDSQLKKIITKYEFNKRNGQSERGLRRLKKAIANIEVTIEKCKLYIINKQLIPND